MTSKCHQHSPPQSVTGVRSYIGFLRGSWPHHGLGAVTAPLCTQPKSMLRGGGSYTLADTGPVCVKGWSGQPACQGSEDSWARWIHGADEVQKHINTQTANPVVFLKGSSKYSDMIMCE